MFFAICSNLSAHTGEPVMDETAPQTKQYTPQEIDTFIQAWKGDLEIRYNDVYSRYLAAALSGIVTIIITIGLTVDKLSKLGWFERSLIAAALIMLVLSAGNVMNGVAFATNARLELLTLERDLVLKGQAALPEGGLDGLNKKLLDEGANAVRYFPHAYWTIFLAMLLGIVGFFFILAKA
jgi:hypothetical protein